MATPQQRGLAVRSTILFALLAFIAILLIGAFPGRRVRASALALPKVTAISQSTHDGASKSSLLSDDTNLYVTEMQSARRVIAKIPLQGSSRTVFSTPFLNVQALDLSPDHSRLLVSSIKGGAADDEFWTVPSAGGSPARLNSFTGRDAAWSADGQKIAFAKGSMLYLAEGPGTEAKELFTANGYVFGPRFSPDGRRIRFTVGDAAQNKTSLWEIGDDGFNPHALFSDWQYGAAACCGSWTPDGRYYIFQATQSSPTTIATLWASPDSGAARTGAPAVAPLTSGPISFGNPFPARDNQHIFAIGVQPAAEAVKYDAARKKFVSFGAGVPGTDLDFSPDGKWVTYVTIPEGALWRSRINGTERMKLTSPTERAALPHWSPDGKQIAFVSMKTGQPFRISIVSADGGATQELLPESRSQIDVTWSPDGSRIMFGYVHDVEGLNIRIVDVKTREVETVPESDGLFSPRWSPDGRYIAALSPDYTKVMLYDFDSQKWSNWLTEPAGAVSYPSWSRDSKYLYFDDLVTDEESIRKVRVGESQTERVLKLQGIERYLGAFGLWTGQAPDGSWMFVRDRSTQEVYRLTVELP